MTIPKITAFVLLLFLMGTAASAQSEIRSPGKFTEIQSGGSWNVYVTVGDRDEVRLVSKGFDLKKVITAVEDGKLEIKLERGTHREVNFEVYVTVRELQSIGSSGSGNIKLESNIDANKFNIGLSGSGNIKMKVLNAKAFTVGMSGSGNVYVGGGMVDTVTIGQSGSGDFDALELMAISVKIGKSGSGNTSIGASGNLTVAASGSGHVYYKGNPDTKKIASSGSGKVSRK